MREDMPYSKRELDMMFSGLHSKLDDFIEESKKLYIRVSNDSGRIDQLWQANAEIKRQTEANSKATHLIDEITTTWKVGKIVVGVVVSILVVVVAIKTMIFGKVEESLAILKHFIF